MSNPCATKTEAKAFECRPKAWVNQQKCPRPNNEGTAFCAVAIQAIQLPAFDACAHPEWRAFVQASHDLLRSKLAVCLHQSGHPPEMLGQLHVDCASASNNIWILQGAPHDHDRVVQRPVRLIQELQHGSMTTRWCTQNDAVKCCRPCSRTSTPARCSSASGIWCSYRQSRSRSGSSAAPALTRRAARRWPCAPRGTP